VVKDDTKVIDCSDMKELVKWFQLTYPKEVREMRDCNHHYSDTKLNPYHLEGDIWTHTMMVCNELKNSRDPVLNVAALLHDIGKPPCRIVMEDKERVGFHSHESVSAFMSLSVTKKLGMSDLDRIEVFKLIAMHTEFFKLSFDKITDRLTRQQEFCDRLKRLSNADKNGRFFEGENTENSFPEVSNKMDGIKSKVVTVMVGLPCSGKSFMVEENTDKSYHIVSRDTILTQIYPADTYEQSWKLANQKVVDKALHAELIAAAKSGKDVVIDMTHMSRKSRRRTLSNFPKKDYTRVAHVCLTDLPTIFKRNNLRAGKTISNQVFEKMMKSFYLPLYDEFDDIHWSL